MTRTLKLLFAAVFACICQTNLVQYIRIAGVAPDMMIVFLVLLTSYTGPYGGFCTGCVLAMLYDASIGYVLAINLVAYPFIGWAAPSIRHFLYQKKLMKRMKHKSFLVMMLICFFLTLAREVLYIGYLFLIGSEQSVITLIRALLCSGYSALMIIPGFFVLRRIMRWRLPVRSKRPDFEDKKDVTES